MLKETNGEQCSGPIAQQSEDVARKDGYWRGWNAHIEWCRYVIEDYRDGKINLGAAFKLITGEHLND